MDLLQTEVHDPTLGWLWRVKRRLCTSMMMMYLLRPLRMMAFPPLMVDPSLKAW